MQALLIDSDSRVQEQAFLSLSWTLDAPFPSYSLHVKIAKFLLKNIFQIQSMFAFRQCGLCLCQCCLDDEITLEDLMPILEDIPRFISSGAVETNWAIPYSSVWQTEPTKLLELVLELLQRAVVCTIEGIHYSLT